MRIMREEVVRFAVQVRKIAATTSRHQDFLPNLVGTLEHDHIAAAPGGRYRTHEAGRASTNYQDISHAARIAGSNGFLR